MGISCFQVTVQHELDAVEVLRSAHQERAADAESARGAAYAQTGVATVAKRDGVQAAVAFENLARAFVSVLALIEADTVVVAGYGFADADDYIASLFALDVLSVSTKRVVVFGVSDRATSKLEKLRSRYALDRAVSEQLVTVIGPAEDTLPLVADRVLSSSA